MDLFVTHHRTRFMINWETWRNFVAIDKRDGGTVTGRAAQLVHMRRQMRYRAYQYAEARGWEVDYNDKG